MSRTLTRKEGDGGGLGVTEGQEDDGEVARRSGVDLGVLKESDEPRKQRNGVHAGLKEGVHLCNRGRRNHVMVEAQPSTTVI